MKSYKIIGFIFYFLKMSQGFRPKYKINNSKAAENLEGFTSGNIHIPKWVFVVGLVLSIGCLAIFTGSIIITLNKKPNGLHNQSCASRNCEKKLGLKCIDKICQCTKNHFFLDSCRVLSTYNEPCIKDLNCKQDQSLICGIMSKCDCTKHKYWDNDFGKCLNRKTYGESCNGDNCITDVKLSCQFNKCICFNKEMYVFLFIL